MKLYLIQSYDFGAMNICGEGQKTLATGSLAQAQKAFADEIKRLRKKKVRYQVRRMIVEHGVPDKNDWITYFEEGEFPNIKRQVLEQINENASVTM